MCGCSRQPALITSHRRRTQRIEVSVKRPTGSVTIFAFDKGQELSEHTASFDALEQVVEGETEIMISGQPHRLHGGEMILIPANQPHALKAVQRFKMMLTKILP